MSDGEMPGRKIGKKLVRAILFFVVFAVAIPVVLGALFGIPVGAILGLIGSTLLLQAAAPPVGIALGLSAPAVLVVMACFALGMVLAIFEICDSLAASSPKVKNWVEGVEKKTEKYPQIQKYGAISCIGIAWIPGIGLYGTPVIAWIMSWKRSHAIAFTVAGFTVASIFVLFFASKIPQLLFFAVSAGVVIFIVTSMLTLGFSFTVPEILAPLKDKTLLIIVILANFILVPGLAYLLVAGMQLPQGLAVGMILVGAAAGSPFLPRVIHVGTEKRVLAGAIAVILTILSVFYLPVAVAFMIPGELTPNPVLYLVAIIVITLLPLFGGLVLRSRREARVLRITPWLSKISYVSFIAAFIAVFFMYFDQLPALIGTGGLIAIIIFILLAFGIGYLAAGKDTGMRGVLSFGTAQRNLAVAAVFPILTLFLEILFPDSVHFDPAVLVMVLMIGMAGLVMVTLIGRQRAKQS